jgi:Na+/H+ antiporter NhaD/arsenite permease-like protein
VQCRSLSSSPAHPMLRGLVVFAITYVLVSSRRLKLVRLDRPAGALVGAVLAVAVGAISPEEAARAVDQTTIVLLFAVMGMGAFLSLDGFFERAGRLVVSRVKTKRRLVGAIVWAAGLLGAVVTNDAVCVLLAPLVVEWIRKDKLPRLPLLAALATGANTGSVATLVGNPQNMLCGSLESCSLHPSCCTCCRSRSSGSRSITCCSS